jgi:hypothetical protein
MLYWAREGTRKKAGDDQKESYRQVFTFIKEREIQGDY